MTRAIKAVAALAMAGASILCATSQASADPNPNNHGSNPMWIQLRTANHVGVYTCADAGCSKYANGLTLSPGDSVLVDCWVSGGNVGNAGDVWYRTSAVIGNGQKLELDKTTWTFGPYVDYATAFRVVPGLPHC
ncbi:hypothetical protein ACWD5Q_10635 [Streptomyces sp. NPDC002513]